MNMLEDLKTRRLGLIELWSMGWLIYFKKLRQIFFAYCLTYLPFLVGFQILLILPLDGDLLLLSLLAILSLLILPLAQIAYYIAVAIVTENFLHQKNSNPYKMIYSKFIPYSRIYFRFYINAFLRMLLLFIPGIIYSIYHSYFGLALILRDQRGKAALDYSKQLVEENWWRVFLLTFAPSLLNFVIQSLIGSIFDNIIWTQIIAPTISSTTTIGFGVSGILLFINLEYQKGTSNNEPKVRDWYGTENISNTD